MTKIDDTDVIIHELRAAIFALRSIDTTSPAAPGDMSALRLDTPPHRTATPISSHRRREASMFNSTATSRRTWTNVQNQLSTSRESLGAYPTYADAQRVVDALADQRFEVQTTQIVGSDLRMVEQITGRLTWPRAILSGAAGGAWFGLFVGLLLNLLSTATFLRAMAFGLFWGVLFGAAFTAIGYAMTGGRRDFTSLSSTIPSRFEVLVLADHADHARSILATSTA